MQITVDIPTITGSTDPIAVTDGRIVIPVNLRDWAGRKWTVTKGVEKCLWLLPREVFLSMVKSWTRGMSLRDEEARALDFHFAGSAFDTEPDRQGRLYLNDRLRAYAGIESKALVVGAKNRIEIWSPEDYDAFGQKLTRDLLQGAWDKFRLPDAAQPEPAPVPSPEGS